MLQGCFTVTWAMFYDCPNAREISLSDTGQIGSYLLTTNRIMDQTLSIIFMMFLHHVTVALHSAIKLIPILLQKMCSSHLNSFCD